MSALPIAGALLVQAGFSLGLAALLWHGGGWLHRRLALSHAAGGYWSLLWAGAALPPLLLWLLQWALPRPVLATVMSPLAPLPLPLPISGATTADTAAGESGGALANWIAGNANAVVEALAIMVLALYLSGVLIALWRQLRVARTLAAVVAAAIPVERVDLDGPLCAAEWQRLRRRRITLRLSAAACGPFALAWPRRCIVVPAALLARLSDVQVVMLLRHEAHHLARRDPLRAALMRGIGALLWFNPWLPRLAARVQTAAELACDAAATALPGADRRHYAQAYLLALRQGLAPVPSGVTGFAGDGVGQQRLRLQQMLEGDRRRPWSRRAAVGLAALVLTLATGGGVAAARLLASLPAVASTPATPAALAPIPVPIAASVAPSPDTSVPVAAVPPSLQWPLPTRKINSRFGSHSALRSRPHRGLDLAGRSGTQVLAPAAGTVVAATTAYPGAPNYGNVVVLDHGNGWQTLYAHLQDFTVRRGQHVASGQRIGRVGRSGRATGPHLHLEVLHDGIRVDPEALLR